MSWAKKPAQVIALTEKLRRKGLLDGPSLSVAASAYSQLKLHRDALNAHLSSKITPVQCQLVEPYCPWIYEFSDTIDHWTDSQYYQASGDITHAEKELNAGNLAFFESCRKLSGKLEQCQEKHKQLLNYYFNTAR